MTEHDSQFHRDIEDLRTLRDELRVKAHLGRLEAEDAWHDLEARWEDLEAKAAQLRRETGDSLADIQSAAKLLASELKEGYVEIKRRLFS